MKYNVGVILEEEQKNEKRRSNHIDKKGVFRIASECARKSVSDDLLIGTVQMLAVAQTLATLENVLFGEEKSTTSELN